VGHFPAFFCADAILTPLRFSDGFRLHHAHGMDAAYRFAWDVLGLKDDWWHLTVHWKEVGIFDPTQTAPAFQAFVDGARRWFTRNGLLFVAIGIRENPKSHFSGEHFHMALHCPKAKNPAFKRWCRTHLKPDRPNAIVINPAPSVGNLVRGYFMKGGNQAVYDEYGDFISWTMAASKRKPNGQGRIIGKRTFISGAINAKAQGRGRSISLVPDQPTTRAAEAQRLADQLGIDIPSHIEIKGQLVNTLEDRAGTAKFIAQCKNAKRLAEEQGIDLGAPDPKDYDYAGGFMDFLRARQSRRRERFTKVVKSSQRRSVS